MEIRTFRFDAALFANAFALVFGKRPLERDVEIDFFRHSLSSFPLGVSVDTRADIPRDGLSLPQIADPDTCDNTSSSISTVCRLSRSGRVSTSDGLCSRSDVDGSISQTALDLWERRSISLWENSSKDARRSPGSGWQRSYTALSSCKRRSLAAWSRSA